MNACDSILTNHSPPSTTCLFSFDSVLITLSPSLNLIMLSNSSSSNISRFEHRSSSTNTTINSFNKSILSMVTLENYLHSSKPHSTLMNNSLTLCTMRKAMLISSNSNKVLFFDVIFSITKKPPPTISFLTKMQSSSTFIMLSLIFHR